MLRASLREMNEEEEEEEELYFDPKSANVVCTMHHISYIKLKQYTHTHICRHMCINIHHRCKIIN